MKPPLTIRHQADHFVYSLDIPEDKSSYRPITPSQLLFLPGALGVSDLWRPVEKLLRHPAEKFHIGWPGFADEPSDPNVQNFDDLVHKVARCIDKPTAIIAQSMGGAVALRAALEAPSLVTHLVLSVTSGGIDVSALGAEDWRTEVRDSHSHLPDWFFTYRQDLSAQLPQLDIPALLLWGDADPISPVRVGERLAKLLPRSCLHVVPNGEHDLARVHPELVADLIDKHLGTPARNTD